MGRYVDVIVPLPLGSRYTYLLPDDMAEQVAVGCRVVVPFGRKKYYTAIVVKLHDERPQGYEVKQVLATLDAHPILLPLQLRLWQWLADYYLCTPGDVMKAALPSGLKLESETLVEYNADYEATERLPEREQRVLDVLAAHTSLSITALEKESGLNGVLGTVKRLLEKEAVFVKEELKRTYRPKLETRVRLTEKARNEHRLHIFFDELQRRAPRQLDLLMKYLELSGFLGQNDEKEVSKSRLLQQAQASQAIFNGLVEKGILEVYRQEVERRPQDDVQLEPPHPLSVAQQRAYDEVVQRLAEKNVCLLQGVTASGKTEIYIHLIEETIRQGRQVLYLLPEIALTTQITERLRRVFGKRMGVYHSKFPDAQRVEVWQKQL